MNTYPNFPTLAARSTMRVLSTEETEDHSLEVRTMSGLDLVIVRGWSIAPTVSEKYADLLQFISAHLAKKEHLTIYIKYELFNPLTVKYLFKIIMLLNYQRTLGHNVKIYWDAGEMMEDMLDTGYDLAQFCDFEFKISHS